jgi:hypothetical protein
MDACPTGAIDYSSTLHLAPGFERIAFLLSAWLVAGSISLIFVPDVLLKLFRWMMGWFA